jgi:diguanylate cyclase (GGDEF)-like protein
VTVIAIDLNRLKEINDRSGHAAGDALLRRAGEVLGEVGDRPVCAARIGGDEFVLLMPASDERAGQSMIERVQSLIELNNSYYPGATLSLAMGCATAQRGDRLEAVVSLADERMMVDKREFYAASGYDRRSRPTPLGNDA